MLNTASLTRSRRIWPRLTLRRFSHWLVALDASHRERVKLEHIDDRTLRDVGLTRADVRNELVELRRTPHW